MGIPDCFNPSDKPPQPAKISNVAKRPCSDACTCFSTSKSSSPSLHFPFFFLDAASLAEFPVENLDLICTGNCPKKNFKEIEVQLNKTSLHATGNGPREPV